MRYIPMAALAALCAAPAVAKDAEQCPTDMVCASDPGGVAGAMMRAGYQALIEKDSQGDPKISSATSGYKFDIYFYGCEKNVACDSIQFNAAFTPDPAHTIRFANEWNKKKRFVQMSVSDEGDMYLSRDVSTIGGLTAKNFADELDWWTSLLGDLGNFFDQQTKPAVEAKPRS